MDFLGVLSPDDPLHGFLAHEVLGLNEAVFDVQQLHPEHLVLRYTERNSGADLACKFFGRKPPVDEPATDEYYRRKLFLEYDRLRELRALGFDRAPHRVVRPLAVNEQLEYVLVEEFVTGPTLADCQDREEKLADLGRFLRELHRRSAREETVPAELAPDYLAKMLGQLDDLHPLPRADFARLDELHRDQARAAQPVPASLIHGDCTPLNFVFPADGEVTAIDLERCRAGDPCQDTGAIEAELLFARFRGEGQKTDREAFHRGYGAMNEDRHHFWTATYLLRISRNDWVKPDVRGQLVKEAIRCLTR